MILNDIVNEYKFVYDTLQPCSDYFSVADKLITEYFSNISKATSTYFKVSSPYDSNRQTLASELSNTVSATYTQVTALITASYEFYGALKILETKTYVNPQLEALLIDFVMNAHRSIEATNAIIKAQLPGMKTQALLPALIEPLQSTIKIYHTLTNLYDQFSTTNELLCEPLPDGIAGNPNYDVLSFHSETASKEMSSVSCSLVELGHFLDNIGRVTSTSDLPTTYYLRKIETGSLLTAVVTTATVIGSIIKFVDYCYPKFIEWQRHYLTNKEMQLKLAADEIKTVKELLEIDSNIPNSDELLEKASVRLFKYFKMNPNFKLNEKEYKTTLDCKLLQTIDDESYNTED